ncbi:MAG TPA: nuclear transport factor 2 family protein, partial [Gemmatimonadales bacterium]|nr:nuclear transport factor 2 family protein [Gemmatimonadales bacterium]
ADSAAVVRAVAAYDAAWSARDTAAVGRWLAPAYRYFTSQGGVSTRAQVLAMLADPAYRVEWAERSAVEPWVAGGTAVVSSRWRGRGTWSGGRFDDDQRCSLVLVKERAGWRLVAEHCTQIVAGPA